MIDSEGYRPNVGIILSNGDGRLFWAKRIGQHSWQFPQGGIRRDESPEQAMFRELAEEVGLRPEHVQVIGCTRGWLRYRLPKRLIRQSSQPPCIGQKQVWFLLRMMGGEDAVCLDSSEHPEFDHWQWVDYWYPLRAVVPFKRHVYWRALRELAPLLLPVRWPKRAFPARRHDEARRTSPSVRALEMAVEIAKVAIEATCTAVTAPEPARLTPVEPASVVPLRAHPVITRMVVSARRGGTLEPLTVMAAPPLDGSRTPNSPSPRSRDVSRR